MSTYSIDIDKIKEVGDEIKKISSDFSILINELYDKMSNVENANIWKSESDSGSASQFINIVTLDKSKSIILASSMNSLGNKIVDYADKLADCANNKL